MDKHSAKHTEKFDERMQQRLEAVLDGMPVAVSWAGLKDQKIVFVNSKFRELFGYELGDHPTVTDWIQHAYPDPSQVERAMAMWAPHFETSAIVPFEIDQVEVDVKCKNGSIRTTLLGGVILPSEGWALAIFTDITDRKRAERPFALEIDDLAHHTAIILSYPTVKGFKGKAKKLEVLLDIFYYLIFLFSVRQDFLKEHNYLVPSILVKQPLHPTTIVHRQFFPLHIQIPWRCQIPPSAQQQHAWS